MKQFVYYPKKFNDDEKKGILRSWRNAAIPEEHINVLCELNACDRQSIINVLCEAGITDSHGNILDKVDEKTEDKIKIPERFLTEKEKCNMSKSTKNVQNPIEEFDALGSSVEKVKRVKWTDDKVSELKEYIKEGMTYKEIGSVFGVSASTIGNVVARIIPKEELADLRAEGLNRINKKENRPHFEGTLGDKMEKKGSIWQEATIGKIPVGSTKKEVSVEDLESIEADLGTLGKAVLIMNEELIKKDNPNMYLVGNLMSNVISCTNVVTAKVKSLKGGIEY